MGSGEEDNYQPLLISAVTEEEEEESISGVPRQPLGMASALETLCGQAYEAKKHHMLGIYMQRSWIVLFLSCFLLLPVYIFASPILKLLDQPDDEVEQTGVVALWMIPMHFLFAFVLPTQRYLQCQLKTGVFAWVSGGVLVFEFHPT